MKRLFLVALATLNTALAGCGHVPAGVGMAAPQRTHAATIMAAGHQRKLGFDLDRYQQQAPSAHPHSLPRQGMLPGKIDLRADASPIEDQGDLSSCTAFSVGKGMREYLANVRHEANNAPLSALFLYYETRKLRGPKALENDTGATLTDAVKAASAGVATEATWGYDMAKFAVQPPAAAYAEAGAHKLTGAVQLAGLDDIKAALANKQPVVFGMRLFRSFENVTANGKLPMPAAGDVPVGGHAVTVLGYDNAKQVLIIKNSFGTGWGDKGYFYMPYAYVAPDRVMDIWTASL